MQFVELYTALYNTFLHHPPTQKTVPMDTKSVEIVPNKQVVLYKLNNSKNWHVRIKVPEERGYWKKTTGTADFEQARIKAIGFYTKINDEDQSIRDAMLAGRSTVEKIANEFLKSGNINQNDKTIVNNYIIPKLGKLSFSKLKYKHIEEYLLSCNIKSESSFANHTATLSKFFRFGLQNEHIKNINHLSINKRDFSDNFVRTETDIVTPEEWKNIMTMKNQGPFLFNTRKELSKRIREKLMDIIFIIVSTGIRPGNEIEEIEFRDLRFTSHKDKVVAYLKIRSGKVSKKHQREIPLNEVTTKRFSTMIDSKAETAEELNNLVKENPSQKFFYVEGKRPEYARNFSRFVDICKKNKSIAEEKNITLYSFRHSYITTQLKQKRDIYALAKYCGTSVKMIEDFYSKYKSVIESESVFDQPFTIQ